MKLSEVPKDKVLLGLLCISAIGRDGMIYEIDKDAIRHDDWLIWIKWWDGETSSYKKGDISGVLHFQADKIRVAIPECCYECYYEEPEHYCSWLNTKIHNDNGLFCPPGKCPLREEEWPKSSEDEFENMAEEDPERLARWIKSETLGPGRLTFAAEVLGNSELHPIEKQKALLPLLKHPHALAREGAVYGLESIIEDDTVRRRLKEVVESDSSQGVRSAAKEALEGLED